MLVNHVIGGFGETPVPVGAALFGAHATSETGNKSRARSTGNDIGKRARMAGKTRWILW
jgi:hypothetical protein